MSNNAIAFVAGLGSGYLSAKDKQDKQKRDDEDRALRNEASQLQINASKKQITDAATLAAAGAPVTMQEGAGGMLKPATMDNRDVGLAENSTLPDQGLQQGGFNVAGRQFADRGAADAEVAAQNAPEARQKRVIAAMSGIDPLKAMDAEQTQTQRQRETIKFSQEQETYAKRLKDEGAIDALKALRRGDGAGMVAAFNKGGEFQIEGEPVMKTEPREIAGMPGAVPTYTATFQVKGKDGKLSPMTINSHDLGMSLMPYEKWFDAQLKGGKEQREGRESESKIGLQGAQTGYYESAAGAKDATATKVGVERMSEIDKAAFGNINKQREQINSAMTKAQAESTWDAASPGAKTLTTKLAALSLQESQLQARYGDGGGSKPDPLGMRSPASRPAAGGGITSGGKQGQIEILDQEWGKAQSALALPGASADSLTRARADLDSLTKEYSRLGVNKSAAGAPVAAAGGIPAAPARAQPAAVPATVATPAAAAPPATAKPNLASAMGATGTSAIDQIVARKVPVVQAAADAIRQASTTLAAVAKSGDPQALALYAGQVTQARAQFDALVKDMNPQQAEAVRQAAGYYL